MKRIGTNIFSRNRGQTAIVLFLAIFTFFLLFTLRVFEQTGDSLWYAGTVKTGLGMFHANHLLYAPIVHLFYLVFSSISKSFDAIFAAQIHNIIWATVTIVAFYLIARRLLGSTIGGLLAATCLLITQGFWIYSTIMEPYLPATGCLTLIIAVLVFRSESKLGTAWLFAISLLLAMSVLYAQLSVLFCIPLSLYLILSRGRQGWKAAATVLLVSGAIVLSAYILVYVFSTSGNRSPLEFLRFCLGYGINKNLGWGTFEHFSVDGVYSLLLAQGMNIVTSPIDWRISAVISAVAGTILVVFNAMQIVKRAAHYEIRSLMLTWIITYFIYNLWWLPGERDFFVTTLIPIMLLVFITLKDWSAKLIHTASERTVSVALQSIVLIVIVAVGNGQPFLSLHSSRGWAYDWAYDVAESTPQECLACLAWYESQNLQYYFDRRWYPIHAMVLESYREERQWELPQWQNEECMVVPWTYITPWPSPLWTCQDCNGYDHPREWLTFIEWLFNFKYDSQHRVIGCNEFKVFLGERTKAIFVEISSTQMEVEGLDQLFSMLDQKISEVSRTQTNTLQSWLSTAYPR